MKVCIRSTMLGLLMGATAVPAFTLPQGTERTPDARSQASTERARPAPARQDTTRQPALGNAVQERGGDGSGQAGSGNRGENTHVPDKRVYFHRLQLEVGVHRTRMARLDRLDRIYAGKGMRAKVSEVQLLRNREVHRFGLLLNRFRDALGTVDYEAAATTLRIRGREADQNRTRQGVQQGVLQRSAPQGGNERKTNTRGGGKDN